MTETLHPREQLSAYLDGALTPAERAAVDTHLGSCADCRSRLAELRGVSTLLRSLADPTPSRRLVPRLGTVPAWIAPLRTLATLASGISVFLFMASAILANIGFLAGQSSTAANGAAAVAPQAAPASITSQDRAAASAGATSDTKAAPTAPGAFAAASAAPTPVPPTNARVAQAPDGGSGIAIGPSPWVWLVLAIVTGVIALALQRRLRSI